VKCDLKVQDDNQQSTSTTVSIQIKKIEHLAENLKCDLGQQFLFLLNERVEFTSNICVPTPANILPPIFTSLETQKSVSRLNNFCFPPTRPLKPLLPIQHSELKWHESGGHRRVWRSECTCAWSAEDWSCAVRSRACCLAFSAWASTHCLSLTPNLHKVRSPFTNWAWRNSQWKLSCRYCPTSVVLGSRSTFF